MRAALECCAHLSGSLDAERQDRIDRRGTPGRDPGRDERHRYRDGGDSRRQSDDAGWRRLSLERGDQRAAG